MKNILIINGALGGVSGNTQVILNHLENNFPSEEYSIHHLDLKTIFTDLNDNLAKELLAQSLKNSHGLIFATGTHWDSWSSLSQKFFELMTDYEASEIFLGKPICAIVSMHSVGGKGVLSRLQGVFNTLGMLIAPMSGFVYSLVNQLALESEHTHGDDLWSLEDLSFITHNFKESVKGTHQYQSWPVDKKDPTRIWIRSDEN